MKETGRQIINGYEYITYEGGTTTAKGYSQNVKASREGMQKNVGGIYKLDTDERGHLIGAQHNGTANEINLSAQDASLNRGPYRTIENIEKGITRNSDNPGTVYMEKTAYAVNASEAGVRPEAYMVNDTITYADGQTQYVNLSFANLSPQEQEMYGKEVSKYDIVAENPGDRLRETMNDEEYSDLMNSTEDNLPSIKDEYSMATEYHYDYSAIEDATNQQLDAVDMMSGGNNVMEVDSCEASDMSVSCEDSDMDMCDE